MSQYKPLSQCSVSKDDVTMYHGDTSLEHVIKMEEVDLEPDYIEYSTDVHTDVTDMDEQMDNYDIKEELIDDKQNVPVFNNTMDIESSRLDMIAHTNVGTRNVKSQNDNECPEFNIDVNIEKTDIDEQTDYNELLVDSSNDCIYNETIEDNNDGQTYPLFDCNEDFEETSSLAPNLDDHTNIETIKIISPQDNEYPECNIDVKIEKTDIDDQTDFSELLVDSPNDCIYTETIEDNDDEQTYPLFDCNEDFEETSSLAPNLDDHTNIETTIKIISPHDNDIPPIKKRKTKLQHRASKTSGETATTSGISNDITPVDSTASQHRNTETKPKFCESNRCDKDTANISKSLNTIMIRNDTKVLPKKTIKTKRSLKKLTHHVSHTGKKQFCCDNCSFKCTYKGSLVTHMRTHTGEKPYSCEICEFKSAQKGHLKQHMLTHSVEKPFSCEICEYKSARKGHLKSHLKTHSGEKPFSCEICENKFAKKGDFNRHMLTHSGEKPFSCEICENKFAEKGNLKRHMLTHSGEKPFSCEICENKFAGKGTLKRHMLTHSGEKPFSCEICENKFAQKNNLKTHMKTHSGEKPFSCDICENKFAEKGTLKRHMLTHSGEKPFSCEICENKFAQKNNLKKHILTHSGENPFSCDICSYRYKHKGSLVKHMRTHTGEKLFSCDICDYKCSRNGSLKRESQNGGCTITN